MITKLHTNTDDVKKLVKLRASSYLKVGESYRVKQHSESTAYEVYKLSDTECKLRVTSEYKNCFEDTPILENLKEIKKYIQ